MWFFVGLWIRSKFYCFIFSIFEHNDDLFFTIARHSRKYVQRTKRRSRINLLASVPLRYVWHWFDSFYHDEIVRSSVRCDRFDEIMSVLSKCINHVLSTQNCHQIVHPHTSSCMHSALESFWKPVPTTAKFFLPFFLVTTSKWVPINTTWFSHCFFKKISLASKRDKLDGLACRELAATFLYATSAAFLTGTIGRWFMCILQ